MRYFINDFYVWGPRASVGFLLISTAGPCPADAATPDAASILSSTGQDFRGCQLRLLRRPSTTTLPDTHADAACLSFSSAGYPRRRRRPPFPTLRATLAPPAIRVDAADLSRRRCRPPLVRWPVTPALPATPGPPATHAGAACHPFPTLPAHLPLPEVHADAAAHPRRRCRSLLLRRPSTPALPATLAAFSHQFDAAWRSR